MGGDSGAALVEAALLLPLFFALTLGLITFGQAYFERLSLEDAVRDGTRFGTTMESAFDDPAAAAAVVKQRVVDLAAGTVTLGEVCVAFVTVPDVSPPSCGVDDPNGSDGNGVVKVSASTTAKVEVIFFATDLTLRAEAVGEYER
ncbi:MAG TPA: TadE/TadG family type IV pilus assembly protein [Acidimicrobiales bacterium]|jgi:Flp pilus assembly protein TadG